MGQLEKLARLAQQVQQARSVQLELPVPLAELVVRVQREPPEAPEKLAPLEQPDKLEPPVLRAPPVQLEQQVQQVPLEQLELRAPLEHPELQAQPA